MKRLSVILIMVITAGFAITQWITLPGCTLILQPLHVTEEAVVTLHPRFLGCFEGTVYSGSLRVWPDEPEEGADDLLTLLSIRGNGLLDEAGLSISAWDAEVWTITAEPAEEDGLDQLRARVVEPTISVLRGTGAELVLDSLDDNRLNIRIDAVTIQLQSVSCSGSE